MLLTSATAFRNASDPSAGGGGALNSPPLTRKKGRIPTYPVYKGGVGGRAWLVHIPGVLGVAPEYASLEWSALAAAITSSAPRLPTSTPAPKLLRGPLAPSAAPSRMRLASMACASPGKKNANTPADVPATAPSVLRSTCFARTT